MTSSLKIMLVSDHYPPFLGGAHRQTQLLSQELRQRGHEVCVVTSWQPGLPDDEDDHGVRVYRLRELRTLFPGSSQQKRQRHHPPYPDPVTVLKLRQIISRTKPDVVHAHGWFSYSAAAALLGKKIPLLISVRDYGYTCATQNLLYRGALCDGPSLAKCLGCSPRHYGMVKGGMAVIGLVLSNPLLKHKLSGVHNISTYTQEITRRDFMHIGMGLHKETQNKRNHRISEVIIPSFREDDERPASLDAQTMERYLSQLPDTGYILFVGGLQRRKGVNQLLEAYSRLTSPPPLVLIGTLSADSPTAYPPGVKVLLNVPHPAVMAAWERCLYGVLPSLWPEPLGSVVYEGMSKGKAVIGTRPGGHTDMIVDGATGLLVPAGDVDALTAAMQKLADDPALRQRLGVAARERAKLFTASVSVPKFISFYQQLIDDAVPQVLSTSGSESGVGGSDSPLV